MHTFSVRYARFSSKYKEYMWLLMLTNESIAYGVFNVGTDLPKIFIDFFLWNFLDPARYCPANDVHYRVWRNLRRRFLDISSVRLLEIFWWGLLGKIFWSHLLVYFRMGAMCVLKVLVNLVLCSSTSYGAKSRLENFKNSLYWCFPKLNLLKITLSDLAWYYCQAGVRGPWWCVSRSISSRCFNRRENSRRTLWEVTRNVSRTMNQSRSAISSSFLWFNCNQGSILNVCVWVRLASVPSLSVDLLGVLGICTRIHFSVCVVFLKWFLFEGYLVHCKRNWICQGTLCSPVADAGLLREWSYCRCVLRVGGSLIGGSNYCKWWVFQDAGNWVIALIIYWGWNHFIFCQTIGPLQNWHPSRINSVVGDYKRAGVRTLIPWWPRRRLSILIRFMFLAFQFFFPPGCVFWRCFGCSGLSLRRMIACSLHCLTCPRSLALAVQLLGQV